MKKLLVGMILALITYSSALADCDWSTITANKDGSFTYPLACHLAVGKLVKQVPLLNQQIADLNKAITLDQLALKDSESRADMWMSNALKLTDTVNHFEATKETTRLEFFLVGAGTVILSAWAVGQIHTH